MTERQSTQSEEAAHEAERNEDESRWTERLKKVAKQGPSSCENSD